ncbi:MAG: hypothetical protein IPP51_11340 [Bacteroidetes bacterium]|nr:hypothetical protein [Bacteroidota bacterium]
MKKTPLLLLLVVLLFSCNPNDSSINPQNTSSGDVLVKKAKTLALPEGDAYSADQMSKMTIDLIQKEGDFKWENQDLKMVWSAAKVTGLVAVGYQPAGFQNIDQNISKINIHTPEWIAVHDALIELVIADMSKALDRQVSREEVISEDHNTLPILVFKTSDRQTITDLVNLQNVRYADPYGYYPISTNSSSGCGGSTYALNSADYTSITRVASNRGTTTM